MDKNELEKIIDIHGNDILSFCHYLTRNREEAEDLCQDVFLVAFQKVETMQLGTQTKSFLLSIAVRLWKNRKRKFAWRKRITDDRILPVITENRTSEQISSDPVNITSSSEIQKTVLDGVDNLPEKLKIPLLLYYMEGMKEREISEILSIPLGTVKSRIAQAKAKLTEIITDKLS